MADPVSLAAYRQRKLALASPAARPCGAQLGIAYPVHIEARPDCVVLRLTNGEQVELSPAHARVWAERLADLADTAEALAREEHDRGR